MIEVTIEGINCLKRKGEEKRAFVLIHGYGASKEDLASLSQVLAFKGDWYFPDGIINVPIGPMMMGKAWFPIDMMALEKAMQSGSHRDFKAVTPPGFEEALQRLETFLKTLKEEYQEVIIGGFSQGAMCSLHLSFKMNLHKVVLLSGNPIAMNLLDLKTDSKKIFMSHGEHDPLLSFLKAQDLAKELSQENHHLTFEAFSGGHEIPMTIVQKLNSFLTNE